MHDRVKQMISLILPSFLLVGCAAMMGLEQRTIVVVDQKHHPIEGAGVFPQPFVPGPKRSGKDGRLHVYVLNSPRLFKINALGYKSSWFHFDQPGDECMLLKAPGIAKR
jgi:hypothetical protein